jgi:hypothetical protein
MEEQIRVRVRVKDKNGILVGAHPSRPLRMVKRMTYPIRPLGVVEERRLTL